jgi:hypothetical protein
MARAPRVSSCLSRFRPPLISNLRLRSETKLLAKAPSGLSSFHRRQSPICWRSPEPRQEFGCQTTLHQSAELANRRAVHAQIAAGRRAHRLAAILMGKGMRRNARREHYATTSGEKCVSETAVEPGPALALSCPWEVIVLPSRFQIEAWPLVVF